MNDSSPTDTTTQVVKDFKQAIANTKRLESLYVRGKLTHAQITKIQDNLDNVVKKYKDDPVFKLYWYVLLEQQALIHLINGNDEGFTKFSQDAIYTKPTGAIFVSKGAKHWETDYTAVTRQTTSNNSNKKQARPFYRRKWVWLGLIVLLAIFLWQPVANEITLSTANPAMVKLAQQAGMSKEGEVLFLRTKPQLVSDTQMESDCSANTAANNSDGFIEQGCYDPTANRIYIRQMPSDLYDLEVSTAAYEMLHPVYINIYNSGQGSALNKSIEANYQAINDSFLNSQVANFAKTEPGARDLELFSLLGTGYSNLTQDLANYYQPYFSNIGDSIAANNQVTQLFQSDVSQLTQLNGTLNTDNNDINTVYNEATTAYSDSVSWANVGNAYENNYNYNIYQQDYNIYSQDITDYNNTVNQYNQILQSYNDLISQYNGQQFNQASPVQTQQQQTSP